MTTVIIQKVIKEIIWFWPGEHIAIGELLPVQRFPFSLI